MQIGEAQEYLSSPWNGQKQNISDNDINANWKSLHYPNEEHILGDLIPHTRKNILDIGNEMTILVE